MKMNRFDITISKKNDILLEAVDFSFASGEITFIFGESGIGKTLIAKSIFGLLEEDELEVIINNQPYNQYLSSAETQKIMENGFFMFQEPSTHLNPLMTINNQLNEGSIEGSYDQQNILNRLWSKKESQKLSRILNTFPKPQFPSGGEKQRILATMSLKKIDRTININDIEYTPIFVFDEPTGHLDNNNRNTFLNSLLDKYKKKSFTILLITHDYSIIGEIYKNHGQLLGKIAFKEISRSNNVLTTSQYDPDEYLSWTEKKIVIPSMTFASGSSEEERVGINSGIHIHSSIFNFYSDKSYKDPIPLVIQKGNISYLKGESGTGKTTVAKIIMGLVKPDKFELNIEGDYINEDTDISYWKKNIWGKKISIVFQHADEALNLNAKVKDIFNGLPIKQSIDNDFIHLNLNRLFGEKISYNFLNKKIASLSGGEKQRLNIIRSLVLERRYLIFDEPTNGMDWNGILNFLDILSFLTKEGIGILIISHYEDIFEKLVPEEFKFNLVSEPV
jgi:peptide/nickel transport system ATP-binding protein